MIPAADSSTDVDFWICVIPLRETTWRVLLTISITTRKAITPNHVSARNFLLCAVSPSIDVAAPSHDEKLLLIKWNPQNPGGPTKASV